METEKDYHRPTDVKQKTEPEKELTEQERADLEK